MNAVPPPSRDTAPVTAIVTAFDRIDSTLTTLRTIRDCRPAPAEVLVHVDGGRVACAEALRAARLADRVLVSDARVGPGGGRNRLVAAAGYGIVASFDDDSWPLDREYFSRMITLFARHPDAAVVVADLYHPGETRRPAEDRASWTADFVNGACGFRKEAYLTVGGLLPLVVAYGMEEADLALRLHAGGFRVLHSHWLRVEHDSDRSHHLQPEITAASIANLALLAALRYPVTLWPAGVWQVCRRVGWLVTHGRRRGIGGGLAAIPRLVAANWDRRAPLDAQAVRSYFRLRRAPLDAGISA